MESNGKSIQNNGKLGKLEDLVSNLWNSWSGSSIIGLLSRSFSHVVFELVRSVLLETGMIPFIQSWCLLLLSLLPCQGSRFALVSRHVSFLPGASVVGYLPCLLNHVQEAKRSVYKKMPSKLILCQPRNNNDWPPVKMTFRFKVVCIDHVPHSTAAESPHLCLVIFPKFSPGPTPHRTLRSWRPEIPSAHRRVRGASRTSRATPWRHKTGAARRCRWRWHWYVDG